jgi:hypothetical protein
MLRRVERGGHGGFCGVERGVEASRDHHQRLIELGPAEMGDAPSGSVAGFSDGEQGSWEK